MQLITLTLSDKAGNAKKEIDINLLQVLYYEDDETRPNLTKITMSNNAKILVIGNRKQVKDLMTSHTLESKLIKEQDNRIQNLINENKALQLEIKALQKVAKVSKKSDIESSNSNKQNNK